MKRITILLFLGMFSSGMYSQAPPAAAPGFQKVVIYRPEGSKAAEESLKGFDGRVVQRYKNFDLVTINSKAAEAWMRHAKGRGLEVAPAAHFDRIYLRGGIIDARLGTAGSHPGRAQKRGYGNGRKGLWIVQFAGPILPEWQERVTAAGATIFSYVQMNALLIAATDAEAWRIGKDPSVQYIDVQQTFLKFADVPRSPGVERSYIVHLASSDETATDRRYLETWSSSPVVPDEDALPGEIRLKVRLEGRQIDDVLALPLVAGVSQPVSVSASDERVAMSVANNLSAGQPLSTPSYKSWLQTICSYCGNLAAEGFRVALADLSGLDGGQGGTHHSALPESRITWGSNFVSTSNPDYSAIMADKVGHATMVATIMAGDPLTGADSAGFLYASGIAPSAGVVMTTMQQTSTDDWEPVQVTSIATLARDAENNNAVVQNHSYNAYTNDYKDSAGKCATWHDGLYTSMSQAFDQRVIDADNVEAGLQPMSMTVSSGNTNQQATAPTLDSCADGPPPVGPKPEETLPPATAKNVIAVGAAENVRTPTLGCAGGHPDVADSFSNLWLRSKRGTKYSGTGFSDVPFIKPDLVAPAWTVTSLISSATPGVAFGCSNSSPDTNDPQVRGGAGTSFAAPVAAGAAVLASRRYAETVRGSNPPDRRAAKPSLVKAMLIAGAKSMHGGYDIRNYPDTIGPLPNAQQGFGRVALDEVLSSTPARVYINESHPLSSIDSEWSDTYVVADSTKLVKIALVWSDPPAAQLPSVQGTPLVNDLDLIVDIGTPCAARFVGNKLSWTTAHGEVSNDVLCNGTTGDHANNVEVIRFANPGAPFTVKVRAATGTMTPTSPQSFSLVVYNAVSATALTPPENVVATAAGSTVTIEWDAVTGATGYNIERKLGSAWTFVKSVSGETVETTTDTPATADGVVLYRVRATVGSSQSAASNVDIAYAKAFTDDPLLSGPTTYTRIKAEHVVELRKAVNTLRVINGDQAIYTGTALDPNTLRNQPIGATAFSTLLGHLNDARAEAGVTPPVVFSGDDPATNVKIFASHIHDLRNGLK